MTRLLIHVEGETEETFVNEVLRDHLAGCGYWDVSAKLMGNARLRSHRGGVRSWPSVRRDIRNHLSRDRECRATTMVDFYGMPRGGQGAWPGRAAAHDRPFLEKATTVEDAMAADVSDTMGKGFDPDRFVPYVMMHEFEALLFSDCDRFASAIERPDLAARFAAIVDECGSPEEIDDSPVTAPSKRIEALEPGYVKPLLGTLAILEIGLETIRMRCPHFHRWLDRLERLATDGAD